VGVSRAHLRRVNRNLLTLQTFRRGSMLSARDTPTGTLHRQFPRTLNSETAKNRRIGAFLRTR
jgi:hypothetical protein